MKKLLLILAIQFIALNVFSNEINEELIKSNFNKSKNNQVFIENKGQWDSNVLFLTKTNGANVWITKSGVTYDYYQMSKVETVKSNNPKLNSTKNHLKDEEMPKYNIKGHIFKMQLENVKENPIPIGFEKKITKFNYFLGNDKNSWASNVSLCNEVVVEDLYDGISARYYFDSGTVRYDYILEVGADVSQLVMKFEGQDEVTVTDEGELLIKTSIGEIKHNKIFAYQEVNNEKIEIECSFFESKTNQFNFELGEYDTSKPIIIDPLIWSTFIGGGADEFSNSIELDYNDNVIITGFTKSSDFPTASGIYDETHNGGGWDVFVSKISNDGSSLLWSTFIGGTNNDGAAKIAFDDNNNLILTGSTGSIDFPITSNAFDKTYNGEDYDAFVSKLSNDGSSLIWSTFIGGEETEFGTGLTIDNLGNVIITGMTGSVEYPTTPGTFNETYNGGIFDIFVSKLSNDGSSLLWSSFLGGSNVDESAFGNGLTLDDSGNIILTGKTGSVNFPVSNGAYNENYDGDNVVFVCKLSNDGSSLLWSTFIGNGGSPSDVAIDNKGNVIITGGTGFNFPTTKGAYDEKHNNNWDVYVSKLSSNGSSLIWSTFIGGYESEFPTALEIDDSGNIFVTGHTESSIYPTTKGVFDETFNNDYDGFISKLSNDGSSLLWSSFIGGSSFDKVNDLVIDNIGNVIISGYTNSTDFPTTNGAYNETYNGSDSDVFVSKFKIEDMSSSVVSKEADDEISIVYQENKIFARYFNDYTKSVINVYSLNGDLVFSKIISGSIGYNLFDLKAELLTSGFYVVKINAGKRILNGKFINIK